MQGRPRSAYHASQLATFSSSDALDGASGCTEFARLLKPCEARRRHPSSGSSSIAGHALSDASSSFLAKFRPPERGSPGRRTLRLLQGMTNSGGGALEM